MLTFKKFNFIFKMKIYITKPHNNFKKCGNILLEGKGFKKLGPIDMK
jgi:hypothetical protein